MENTLKKILHKLLAYNIHYQPLIEVRVFKDVLVNNLNIYKIHYPNLKFAPVLKSNAYGHGLIEVAKILDKENIPFVMVDSFYEALVLRRAGIKSKILILGFVRLPEILNQNLKDTSFGVISSETLKDIVQNLRQPANFHLKIDTGMHRQGIMPEELDEAIKIIKKNPNFILEGVCSHLADADGADDVFTKQQIQIWNEAAKKIENEFVECRYFHLTNSAGSYYSKDIFANVGRLGLGLYGVNPSPTDKLEIKPALEMHSVISNAKKIMRGDKVGYNITYEASQPAIVATVPVGYNEGVDRRLSNVGSMIVKGKFCPIAGRVSMNMSSIDVTAVPDAKTGDEVIVISANPADRNSVENIARLCGCIPWEILVHIPSHLRRTIV